MNSNNKYMRRNIYIISAIVICIIAICIVVYMIGFNNANKQHEDELKEIYSEINEIKDEQNKYSKNNQVDTTNEKNKNDDAKESDKTTSNDDKETKNTTQKADNKLVIGYTYFEPYNYFEGEKLVGFDTELALYVCKQLGYKPVFVNIDWEQKEEMLDSGEIDCVWNGMAYTDDRTESMDLTDVYLELEAEYEGNIEIEKMVIGLKKGNSLVNELNYALATAEQDGVIDNLKLKYNIQ